MFHLERNVLTVSSLSVETFIFFQSVVQLNQFEGLIFLKLVY